jgi:alpha-glucoside transport system permease protein
VPTSLGGQEDGMSSAAAVLANSTWSDAAIKFFNSFGTVASFVGILLLVFYAAGRATGRQYRPLAIAVFLGPAIVLLLIGLVVPAIRTFYLSFLSDDSTRFLGAKNYTWAFSTPSIHEVLLNTLLWIVVAPVVTTLLGLALALLVDRLRLEAVYKSLIFMPMAVSFVGASFIWRFVYEARDPAQPQIGLLSQIAMALGYDNPPNWILTQPLNNFLLMVIMIWVQTGFAMVVLSAAIKAVPDEIVEAARMDGAQGSRLLFLVTIPMIRNTLIVVLTTVMIITLKVFDIVRTMTGGNFGTQVLANEMYSQSFVQFDNGRGSALAVILFAAVLPLVIYNIIQLRRERETR